MGVHFSNSQAPLSNVRLRFSLASRNNPSHQLRRRKNGEEHGKEDGRTHTAADIRFTDDRSRRRWSCKVDIIGEHRSLHAPNFSRGFVFMLSISVCLSVSLSPPPFPPPLPSYTCRRCFHFFGRYHFLLRALTFLLSHDYKILVCPTATVSR